ncbi:MAG: ABC transporter ATP-binding protein [Alphaproteobacteria bacterium]|nr:ABC transporter ATP-binding protein [Alphaproteobacteria bacterium]MBT5389307.1 ABC transporter ATP-binding protein [Alphaproteobacteria bacterium]
MLPKKLSSFLWHFIKRQRIGFAAMALLAPVWGLEQTIYSYVLKTIVDTLSQFSGPKESVFASLSAPLWLGFTTYITLELCFRSYGFITTYVIPKFRKSIRKEMFTYVEQHSHRYFSDTFAGSISNKINDMTRSSGLIIKDILEVFAPILLATAFSIALLIPISLWLASILAIWFSIHLGVCYFFSRKCASYSKVHSESQSTLQGKIVDSISNILNVRLFSHHPFEGRYLNNFLTDEAQKLHREMQFMEKVKLLLGILSLIEYAAIISTTIYLWQIDAITIGDFILIIGITQNILHLAWYMGLEFPYFFQELGVATQALSIITPPHEILDARGAPDLNMTSGKIKFDQVTFSYSPKLTLFKDLSLTIGDGEKIGLVGFSGSGKSTFVNLMLRNFDIDSGSILINGQNIAKVTQSSLRAQIAMIPQDSLLFHRSLWENIRYGKLSATDQDVIAAAKQAHCHEFILEMPEQYDSLVGERGIKLSGGQRQRIAIARAILKDAPILILDEATSALDTIVERKIQESLESLMENRTTIVIAHRLSTLLGMDRIFVFDQGQIIQEGTHGELIDREGLYKQLWEMQISGQRLNDQVVA